MELKKIFLIVVVASVFAISFQGNAFATENGKTGLKINVHITKETDQTGTVHVCANGGGEKICEDSTLGSGRNYQVTLQFGKNEVNDGDSVNVCGEFAGERDCDSIVNSDCRCPEDAYLRFVGNGRDDEGSSSASSSASSSSSSSSSASSTGNVVNIYPNDYN